MARATARSTPRPHRRRRNITSSSGAGAAGEDFDIILTAAQIQERNAGLAARLAPKLAGRPWTAVTILLGATPFAADMMRELSKLGVDIGFDALWLESYRDERTSSGRIVVRADVSRPVAGRGALIIDDVFDSGRTLVFARQHLENKGAAEIMACVFARKPEAAIEGLDDWAFDAPARYLVGYGMDDAGKWRGLPYLGAVKG
jgi:hypoxanthine phosphoribosyltransferase